jgi:hypothetical protein
MQTPFFSEAYLGERRWDEEEGGRRGPVVISIVLSVRNMISQPLFSKGWTRAKT